MDWETDLIDAFEAVAHRDFPNPHRVGCPVHDSLTHLAAGIGMLNPPWSSLIFDGAPPVSMNSRNPDKNKAMKVSHSDRAAGRDT
jgi:hypothetical protein